VLCCFQRPWVATRPDESNPQDVPTPSKGFSSPSLAKTISPHFVRHLLLRRVEFQLFASSDQPRYLFYLYSLDPGSQMSDYHVRPTSRDQQSPRARSLRSRSSSRDMSWRKPVPKFIPSPPISPNQGLLQQHTSSPTSTTFGYTMDRANPFSMSLVSLNHDLPPVCRWATLMPCFSLLSLVRSSC